MPATKPTTHAVSGAELAAWRERYREEMRCQIVHDSLHARAGWTQPFLLGAGGRTVGYGSLLIGGPWAGTRTIFEFYVASEHRCRAFDLFAALVEGGAATHVRAQTNDPLLTTMLHTWVVGASSEKILFEDGVTTSHPSGATVFRRADAVHAADEGEWVLELDGEVVATGGIMYHYNRPYGDIYMEVAPTHRRRGLGSYLVQELKRVCRELGSVPSARCDPTNIASRATLQKAGFVPCGHIVSGVITAER